MPAAQWDAVPDTAAGVAVAVAAAPPAASARTVRRWPRSRAGAPLQTSDDSIEGGGGAAADDDLGLAAAVQPGSQPETGVLEQIEAAAAESIADAGAGIAGGSGCGCDGEGEQIADHSKGRKQSARRGDDQHQHLPHR